MKTYKHITGNNLEQILQNFVKLHQRFSKSYSWNALERKRIFEYNYKYPYCSAYALEPFRFKYKNQIISIQQRIEIIEDRIKYKLSICVGKRKKNIRFIEKLLEPNRDQMRNYKKIKGNKIERTLQDIIAQHEYFKNVYFWKPIGNADGRRAYEEANTRPVVMFKYQGDEITIDQKVHCSCSNIYYCLNIYQNNVKKDIRFIKTLLK